MRVISGELRGRNLLTVPGESTRPTSGMLKGMVFNILQQYLDDAQVLDICAGCGALGIEALSRGASFATFVESDRRALEVLEKNRERCGLSQRSAVLAGDALRRLSLWYPAQNIDLVFCDPPYLSDLYEPLLSLLGSADWMKDDTIVVLEHHRDLHFEGSYGRITPYRRTTYSHSSVTFLRHDT